MDARTLVVAAVVLAGCGDPVAPAPTEPASPPPPVASGPASTSTTLTTTVPPLGEARGDVTRRARRLSENESELLASLRDEIANDPALLTSDMPRRVPGEAAGVRVYGIRRMSLAGVLGFQNGDTILEVNGRPLATTGPTLEAIAEMRSAERYDVRLVRRGMPMVLVVHVVDELGP